MISLAEAKGRVAERVKPTAPVRARLVDALGRHLAEPMSAIRDLPSVDNSAMDGFALRAEETRGATRDRPARFQVVSTVAAGARSRRAIEAHEAARIFTGAPIPEGADAVLRQEAARREGDELLAFVEVESGANIRRRAEEISAGAPLFIRGQRLDPYALGVLASMGIAEVAIHPPPRVSVITIGDELVQPAHVAADHQTYDSNSVLLSALLAELGVPLVSIVQVADEDGAIHSALQRAVAAADIVVTCGGASVGDRDRIKSVLVADGGALDFDALAMKPGKPAGLGVLEGRPVLILPGNPGAAAVAFDQLVRPALLRYQGAVEERVRVPVRLASGQRKQAGLTYLLSARREVRDDGSVWAIVRPQGAGQLLQNVDAEGWVVLPPGKGEFFAGEVVELELFHGAKVRGP